MRVSRSVVGFFVLSTLFAVAPSHAKEDETPLRITAAPKVDENLFLVRSMERIYARWPQELTNRQWLQDWLVRTRGEVSRLRALIRSENLNADTAQLYDDGLSLLDTYETYLANLGAIDRSAVLQASRDQAKVSETAFKLSYDAAKSARQQGSTATESVAGGFVVGMLGAAFESYQRSSELDETKRRSLEAETRKLQAAWATTRANAEVLTAKLTQSLGWQPGEAGFDGFTSSKMSDLMKRRPRDPFLVVANSQIRVDGETASAVLDDAWNCLAAATLVPQNTIFDPYRAEFIAAAADLALLACSKELPNSAYSAGPAKSAPEALRICRTLFSYDPADAGGTGYMQLARALACSGRYAEAVEAANKAKLYHQDPYFSYRYARLMSLVGDTNKSLEWFAQALRLGFSDTAVAKNDPDLSRVRAEQSEAFADLTRVKFSWTIDWGVINADEIVLENTSLFPITNVSFKATVASTGYADWVRSLTCESIPAGGRHTWYINGAGITSRGSDAKGQGSLNCDQNK